MRYTLTFILISVFAFTVQVFGDANASASKDDAGGNAVLPSDFFADALASAKSSDDAMGTQRLVDVKSSELTPSLGLSSEMMF